MLILSRRFVFSSSHTLFRSEWSAEKNREVFGKCSNPNGHGHNYRLDVSVSGELHPETSMIIDASKLKSIVEELIINDVDHRDLNKDVSWMKGQIPTSEAFLNQIWERIAPAISKAAPNAKLCELELWETENICVKRRG